MVVLASTGCEPEGIGDPCTPEREDDATFGGFDEREVNVESTSLQCRSRLCLVNHFRGRVSCPTGAACEVPGTHDAVTATTPPQCADRGADATVYCSCRCANEAGETNDGANYCSCPDGFTCEQLVPKIGSRNEGLTGGYCIKRGTEYEASAACQ